MLKTKLLTSWMQMKTHYQDASSFSFVCRDNYKSMNPKNAHAFKHAARHMQELCNSLSDTLGTSHNAFLIKVNLLSDGN